MSTPAKVLLVGEYTVIQGGAALAVPFPHFTGKLTTADVENKTPDLEAFWNSILDSDGALNIDKVRLELDVKNGLKFSSNIPVGSGLGSSGALVAEIYHKYGLNLDLPLHELKDQMAGVENFFHGKSSGIDPIVCFANKPLALNFDGHAIQSLKNDIRVPHTYLIHSGTNRKTSTFMEHFKGIARSSNFEQLGYQIQQCIEGLIGNEEKKYADGFSKISAFQAEHFQPMICQNVQSVWEEGLQNEQWFVKLCGAGGGGYYLLHCSDLKSLEALGKRFDIIALK